MMTVFKGSSSFGNLNILCLTMSTARITVETTAIGTITDIRESDDGFVTVFVGTKTTLFGV